MMSSGWVRRRLCSATPYACIPLHFSGLRLSAKYRQVRNWTHEKTSRARTSTSTSVIMQYLDGVHKSAAVEQRAAEPLASTVHSPTILYARHSYLHYSRLAVVTQGYTAA
jgi:hypothetical protein